MKYRLSVFISNKYIYAQLIYDCCTIASASSMKMKKPANIDTAKLVGEMIAERAIEKDIKHNIVFDKGKRKYHGKVKALAEAARAKGLLF